MSLEDLGFPEVDFRNVCHGWCEQAHKPHLEMDHEQTSLLPITKLAEQNQPAEPHPLKIFRGPTVSCISHEGFASPRNLHPVLGWYFHHVYFQTVLAGTVAATWFKTDVPTPRKSSRYFVQFISRKPSHDEEQCAYFLESVRVHGQLLALVLDVTIVLHFWHLQKY